MISSSKFPRRACQQAGVTIIEAIFALSLLAMILAVAFAVLMRAMTMSSEARNIDEARNVLNSFADEFMSTSYFVPGTETVVSTMMEETSPTASGLRWNSEDTDEGDHLGITLFEGEYAESSITDPLSDDVRAEVSRQVTKIIDGQLGPLLQATFAIEFPSALARGTVIRKELTVARAIVE